jgi:hypothetical protein
MSYSTTTEQQKKKENTQTTNMKKFVPPITIGWTCASIVFYVLSTTSIPLSKHSSVALMNFSLVYLGVLLAISFTEAWVKFRAPLLQRHVGFDVGRHVFVALNTIELVLCVAMLSVLFSHEMDPPREQMWAIPSALAIIIVLDIGFLTPQLELRAAHIIVKILGNKRHASKEEEVIYKEFIALTTLAPCPPLMYHHIYVALECAKVLALSYYATSLQANVFA